MDYAIGEFVYMLPSDMNLRIGNVKNYNNKILISSPSFKIGTNLKINLSSSDRRLDGDGEQVKLKDKPDVKSEKVDNRRLMVRTEPKVITKPNIEPNKEHKQDVKPNIKFDQDFKKPDTNKITIEPSLVKLNNYEEERLL